MNREIKSAGPGSGTRALFHVSKAYREALESRAVSFKLRIALLGVAPLILEGEIVIFP